MITRERLDIRLHAAVRMLERRITIESYAEDTPWPSQLTLAVVGTRPFHVVWAEAADTKRIVIITAYEPDPAEWDSEFRHRRARP